MHARYKRFFAAVLFSFVGTATLLVAQAPVPVPPIQDQPQPVLVTEPVQTQITPDEQPLTGAQEIGFGSWGPRHSFFTPTIRFAETLQNNPLFLPDNSGAWRGFSSFAGDGQLVKYFGRDAEIRYAGALRYDTFAELQGSDKFTNNHDFLISKRIPFRNWQLVFTDEAQYSSYSNFGSAGMAGLGGVVGQLWQWQGLSTLQLAPNTIRTDLLPSQTILTGRVGRVSNTALAEADFRLNARDMLTLSGTYSLLHFADLLTDSHQGSAMIGFNHNISPRDSVAIEATFTRVLLIDTPYTINAAELTLLYGRKVTGRLSFDVGAGPIVERTYFASTETTNGEKTHLSELDWEARGGVRYRTRHATLALQGTRTFTAGAGVLQGAMVSSGAGILTFNLSRNWTTSLNFTAAHNTQFHSPVEYNNQYTGISFTRRLGLNTSIFANYAFQRQTSSTVCSGPTCPVGGDGHVFGLGLSWSPRPISIE